MEHSRFYLAVSTLTVIILWSLFVLTFMEAFFLLGCWTKLLFPAITQSLVVALHVDLKAILHVLDFTMLTSSFASLHQENRETLWSPDFLYVVEGLEPKVRVRGARGALPVADTATRASGSDRRGTKVRRHRGHSPSIATGHRQQKFGLLIFFMLWKDSNSFHCNCPVDSRSHQFKNWWQP